VFQPLGPRPIDTSFGVRGTCRAAGTLRASAPIAHGAPARPATGAGIETAGLMFRAAPPDRHRAKPIVADDGVRLGAGNLVRGPRALDQPHPSARSSAPRRASRLQSA